MQQHATWPRHQQPPHTARAATARATATMMVQPATVGIFPSNSRPCLLFPAYQSGMPCSSRTTVGPWGSTGLFGPGAPELHSAPLAVPSRARGTACAVSDMQYVAPCRWHRSSPSEPGVRCAAGVAQAPPVPEVLHPGAHVQLHAGIPAHSPRSSRSSQSAGSPAGASIIQADDRSRSRQSRYAKSTQQPLGSTTQEAKPWDGTCSWLARNCRGRRNPLCSACTPTPLSRPVGKGTPGSGRRRNWKCGA